jgi:L-ribulose-5-phosphate 4-epimerase
VDAIICAAVAEMARHTLVLQPAADAPQHLMDRYYRRKHGPDAYYGNPVPSSRCRSRRGVACRAR